MSTLPQSRVATSVEHQRLPPRGPDGRFVATPGGDGVALDLSDPSLYLNRELSWLEYNRRVLAMAGDPAVPLLERLRFLARFHVNLDEFFMVRVAGLRSQVQSGGSATTPDGLTADEQLTAISGRLRPMLVTSTRILHEQLLRLLRRHGTAVVAVADLDDRRRRTAAEWFAQRAFPVLTPMAVDPGRPFPYISNLSVSLAVTVRDPATDATRFARVKVPRELPRFVPVDGQAVLVTLEDLIRCHLDQLFPGVEVVASHSFRVTRSTDVAVHDRDADDLLLAVEEELRRRRFGMVTRLEVDRDVPDHVTRLLRDQLGVDERDTYHVSGGLLRGRDVAQLAELHHPRLRWRSWHPVPHPRLRPAAGGTPRSVFAEVRRGDLLLHHPYTSFGSSVERLLAEASEDPDVLAIKQTLYRTSDDSRTAAALVRAAKAGKQVVALVELTARFGEETNVAWARELERAGVHVVYGPRGMKTHARVALLVRREGGQLRRYVHVGSGSYNWRTARTEADVGLLSCDPALGRDVSALFNTLTGYGRQPDHGRLLVAPWSLRRGLLDRIEREAAVHRSGEREGLIRIKVNALLDPEIIVALYRAARAGVRVRLLVRAICGLRPQLPGISDRIEVTSTIGRFLEHSRILQFGPDELFLGSADLMPRNLDRRVEVLAPVDDPALRAELRDALDVAESDTVATWRLGAGGRWTRVRPRYDREAVDSQQRFMSLATASHAPTAGR